jgi:hypothetical protein
VWEEATTARDLVFHLGLARLLQSPAPLPITWCLFILIVAIARSFLIHARASE